MYDILMFLFDIQYDMLLAGSLYTITAQHTMVIPIYTHTVLSWQHGHTISFVVYTDTIVSNTHTVSSWQHGHNSQ